ncbi:MAG TPA: ImmA/IrrE family metallo-endopeptidase [Candidatus Hydrogenedentes bacterium]|jgi:Zn-dependent peptidase ImmA (M78 family)|nr:ImmA/IrrE family metallo-endopeptidase [Candidatus Hydrogenedentota bacterium]HPJ99081.1 ImmA/IrrE family metallo-endopeptidase [Candidatus Hydrogenedentota bacterium]
MNRVAVKPRLLNWALERSRKTPDELQKRQPCRRINKWLTGEVHPTHRQLQDFATATSTPFGYFFLPDPPEEALSIPDFRTLPRGAVRRPSANLIETLHTMQRRRDWLRDVLIEESAEPLDFVGSASLSDPPENVGQEMRRAVGLDEGWAGEVRTWTEAVHELRRAIEKLGVMAVINGVVGNNTHRKLDVEEFRGFALSDAYAPLIFVNGADYRSAQMFTLAHELAHLWLDSEGLSGFEGVIAGGSDVERFCDAAAAEFLVPGRELRAFWPSAGRDAEPFQAIARQYKVSPIVAARRAWDLHLIGRSDFFGFYDDYRAEEHRKKVTGAGGGDFYNNQNTRVGELFAAEVVRAAKEGRIQFREAYSLTGLYGAAFKNYAKHLGFDML